jgi:hypothetical protein
MYMYLYICVCIVLCECIMYMLMCTCTAVYYVYVCTRISMYTNTPASHKDTSPPAVSVCVAERPTPCPDQS